ncbi:F-box protein [Phanerochaete sordida]|uniref:F-box protein n=1 Tax=Phanerochaete sordida TaxID=48140 RepID=A0A9P3LAR6_9APHY|nr:F-box protein [Phanerochaete sordida]
MTVPDIPPELVTLILENLYEPLVQQGPPSDPDPLHNIDLQACRLVCKSWAVLAAEQLFRRIYFSFTTSVEDVREMADALYPPLPGRWIRDYRGATWPLKPLSAFRDLFAGREDLRQHVRCVLLRGYASDAWDPARHEAPAQHFVHAVDMLPRLRVLRLEHVAISDETPSAGPAPHGHVASRSLQHLTISSEVRPNKQVFRLLRCFAAVDEVVLDPYVFDFGNDNGAAAVQPAAPSAVRSLSVARHDGTFLQHLLPLLDLSKLRTLSIRCGTQANTRASAQDFVNAAGPTLEHLHYAFPYDGLSHVPIGTAYPDLSRCTALKSAVLRIDPAFGGHLDSFNDMHAMIAFARHIQNVHPEALGAHKLVLRIRRQSMRSLSDGSNVSPLNEVLGGMCRRWDTLKEIWIMCEKEEDEDERTYIAGRVKFMLPQPSTNGVLRVLFAQQSMEAPPATVELIITRL